MGQAPSNTADWWSLDQDIAASSVVHDAVSDIQITPAVDKVVALTDGRHIVVLIGETHAPTSWGAATWLRRLAARLPQTPTVYVEQPSTRADEHGEAWGDAPSCPDGHAPTAQICRDWSGARHIDPRNESVYTFLNFIRELADSPELSRQQKGSWTYDLLTTHYWNILTLFYDSVRATVKANVVRSEEDAILSQLIHASMKEFQASIKHVRDVIKSVDSLDKLRGVLDQQELLLFGLGRAIEIAFLSDVLYRDRQVSVMFVGSAHVRSLRHDMTRGGFRVLVDK